jgi:HEAT repeat protein
MAARAAGQVAGGVVALAAALPRETDPRVREAMFTSLIRIGSTQSVNAILPLLRSDDASLRTGALDALRAMPGAVREHLPRLLSDPDTDVRILSCELARGLSNEDATRLLCELLTREIELNVCAAAIEVLTEVGGPQALPALARCQARLADTPFLVFAIKTATDRILSQSTTVHD